MEGFGQNQRLNSTGNIILGVIAILLILFNITLAQFNFDPRISWQTIQMSHTTIVFPNDNDSLAQIVAEKSERIYLRLSKIFEVQPTEKIWIVLDTSYDFLIDATIPYPNPVVYINPTTLAVSLGHYDDWLELVITHELTHAVDMQMRYGLSAVLGKLIGRLYFPNTLGPQWLTEGIAVHFEMALTGGGRTVSPYYDMMLRMAFLENRVTTPDQNCYFLSRWPGGSSAYIYGQSYYDYLSKKYGQSSIIKMRKRYASTWLPFQISESVKAASGFGLNEFYLNWKTELKRHYISQADSIKRKKLTTFVQITRSGYENLSPCWGNDGQTIYYVSINPDRHQQIRAIDLNTGKQIKVKDVNIFEPQISYGNKPHKKLFFSSIEWQKSYSMVNDIQMLEINSGKITQITKNRRARDPAISPSGDQLIYVTQKSGKSDLWLYNLKNKKTRHLLAGTNGQQFYQPAWANDGQRIALSVWEKEGYQNIWILDISNNNMVPLLQDKAKDLSPCWSNDNRYIIFSSDRTGVFNLFAYDLQSQQLLQLTNLIGGAFDPEISPDDKRIVFSGYSSRGFDICVMDWDKNKPVNRQKVILNIKPHRMVNFVYGFSKKSRIRETEFHDEKNQKISHKNHPIQSYSAFNSLLPRFYIPFLSADEKGAAIGAFTFGQDVLNKHTYQLYFQYGLRSHRFGYSFAYTNNTYYPLLNVNISRLTIFRGKNIVNEFGEKDYYMDDRKEWNAQILIPYKKIDYAHSLSFSVHFRSFERAIHLMAGSENPYFEGHLNSWQIEYIFSNAHQFSRSISPVEGYILSANFEQFTKLLKSDLSFYQFHTSGEYFLSTHWLPRHVLHFSIAAAFNNLKTGKIIENSPRSQIRGYPQFSWRKKMFLQSVEYRFPLFEIERSTPYLPIFVKRLHGTFFADGAQYWDSQNGRQSLKSVGFELQFDTVFGYLLDGGIKAGVGFPVDPHGKMVAYISFVTL